MKESKTLNLKDFTNLFQVSKTLRFELVPEEKTKERFATWIRELNELEEPKKDNLFFRDKQIAEAYPVVKSILDKIHEDFITRSLSSTDAKEIDFSGYYKQYAKDKSLISDDDEKKLREKICKTYKTDKEPYNIIYSNKIIPYLISKEEEKEKEKQDNSQSQGANHKSLKDYLENFKGFYTYLEGYNENRKNYYAVEDKSTAVAARIVSDNLPTFCNNIIQFEKNRSDYLSIYDFLKERNIVTQIKIEKDKYKELSPIEEEVFNIDYYKYCLTQDEINNYNEKVGGYNELINLYNQQNKKENKNSTAIKEFDKLYKQIGCGKRKTWFVALKKDKQNELTPEERGGENIYSVERLLTTVKEAGENCFKDAGSVDGQIKTLPQFVTFLRNCHNWDGIYWSKSAVETIYRKYFASGVFPVLLEKLYESRKSKSACITYDKNREVPIQLRDAVELSELFEALDSMESEFVFKPSLQEDEKCILNFSIKPSQNLINLICVDIEKYIGDFLEKSSKIVELQKYNDYKEDEIIKEIKGWFDAAIDAMRIVRYFSVRKNKMKGNVANLTMEQALTNLLRDENTDWFGWYDLIRSYLTKRPQDDVKENSLRLNFGSSCFLRGWSNGYEKTKLGTILKKGNQLYLCILKEKRLFDTSVDENPMYKCDKDDDSYRLVLQELKFNTLAGKGFILAYKEKYSDMGKNDPLKAVKCLQQHIKNKYINKYPLLDSCANKLYSDKKTFDEDVKKALEECYDTSFKPINWDYLLRKEEEGALFLFKISSKDYLTNSNGKKDLQTLYWENVFIKNSCHQLCANAQIFMRKPLKQKPIKHSLGEKLVNKRDCNGNTIPQEIYYELFQYVNKKKEYNDLSKESRVYLDKQLIVVKSAKIELVKDRRFYMDEKYLFHCPIKLNYRTSGKIDVNHKVNEIFGQRDDLQFVGIDRGEKHLIYSCTVDKDCNIVDCKHYDNINGTDYVKKLDERANKRTEDRKNWQELEKIKDLKKGYISHVVHRLVNATIKDKDGNINPHAYIVLEDLSMGFTQGRQKIEKQTYRTLETALASKMNFIVDKDAKPDELGSVSNALQLTPLIKTYADIEKEKQFGVMLYTRANYTSVTDPATGWRKTIYIKSGKDEELSEQILKKFSDIGYDGKDYYFEYTEQNAGKTWRMYSSKDGVSLQRYQYKRIEGKDNLWECELINLNEILDALFAEFDMSVSLRKQLDAGKKLKKYCDSKTAWQSLVYAINMIQQIRNNGEKDSIDDNFLLSPVRNENGVHFDTRNHVNNGGLKAIVDADANGAYNIARKGVIMQAHINIGKNKANLFVSDEEWDLWLLNREKWEKMLPEFAKPTSKS